MIVRERMSSNLIGVNKNDTLSSVADLNRKEGIGKFPVFEGKELVGIITEEDLVGRDEKLMVEAVMTKEVISISENATVEEAARLMLDKDISCLPVKNESGESVGIITKSDIFRWVLELFGVRHYGVRASFILKDQKGELSSVLQTLSNSGADIISVGTIKSGDATGKAVIKMQGISKEHARKLLEDKDIRILDLREV